MNLVQLKVKWENHCAIKRTVIRPITSEITEAWIDGWFAGIAEIIAHKGGCINEISIEDIK